VAQLKDFEVENFDQEVQETIERTPEPELPEKYRGKSVEDIVRMHQEAEKTIGRMGQEVGEVRKLADQLLQQNLRAAPQKSEPVKEETIDDVDFFANPTEAVKRAVEKHPAVLAAQETAVNLARQESLRSLKEAHPDYREVTSSAEFKEWVGKSKVRQGLYLRADRNYDFDAAEELISTFKELRGRTQQVNQEEVDKLTQQKEESLKAASNPAIGGSSEPTGRKTYSRAALIRLRMTDPEKYDSMADDILRAYAEGRVR
jgi:hypothetical protein